MTHPPTGRPDRPDSVAPPGLTGPGSPEVVFDLLRAAGWSVKADAFGNAACWAPDRLAYVGYEPDGSVDSLPVPQDTRWQIVWYHATGKREWTATFDDDTPAEVIAASLSVLVGQAAPGRDPRAPGSIHPPHTPPPTPT